MEKIDELSDEQRIEACQKHVPHFDESAAAEVLGNWKPKTDQDFIAGNPAHAEVRRRWPRFYGECECGFKGIAYASMAHYYMGDW